MAAAVESPRPPPNLHRPGAPRPTSLAFLEPVATEAFETSQLLASAQAEADGLCQEIRRLARPEHRATGGTRSAYHNELEQAQEIYQTVEKELVRLRRQQQELLERSEFERGLRGEAERAQQAAIREQREVLRGVQERLQVANNLEKEHSKAREEAEEARDAAEASLGRLGIELVRLQSREAMLLEECAARRSSEEARAKQLQELRFLRQSAASERQRREEAEALGRERLDDMRHDLQQTRQELDELRQEQRNSQEKWRKQRALERENRQLRERQLQFHATEGDVRSLRSELQDALARREEDRETAEQMKQSQSKVKQQLLKEQAEVQRLRGALQHSEAEALRIGQDVQDSAAAHQKEKVMEKQLAMNEHRIQELCASLIKAESHNSHLEAGCAALPEARREAQVSGNELQEMRSAMHRLHHEEAALRTRNEAQHHEASELNRRMAEINGELHKERGRMEQLRRELRSVRDERDEALAQDWRRVEQVREEKDSKGRLQEECERLRRTIQETRQQAHAELQAHHQNSHAEVQSLQDHLGQQKQLADLDRSQLRTELEQQRGCNDELRQQEKLHFASREKLVLEIQELEDQRSLRERAEAETQQLRSELSALKAQCTQNAAAASAAALTHRNQRILHKQQLDNLNEEHQARLQALNQQHMQQLTVQQHMLDPERLSTFVDDLLNEISCLRERPQDEKPQNIEMNDVLVLPSPQASSRRLAKMRERLAQHEDARSVDPQRTPSPERVTQRPRGALLRLPVALEPITHQDPQEPQVSAEPVSPEAASHQRRHSDANRKVTFASQSE